MLRGIICTHGNDLLLGSSKAFLNNIIEPLLNSFAEGTFCSKAFKYLGVNLKQSEKDIHRSARLYWQN